MAGNKHPHILVTSALNPSPAQDRRLDDKGFSFRVHAGHGKVLCTLRHFGATG